MHQKLLGQSVTLDEPALETSYLLLVETWLERMANPQHGHAWSHPKEECHFYQDEDVWAEGGLANTAQDDTGMLNTWTTMLIYFMTDFNYLHE